MLNLTEFQKKPSSLSDYLPWASLIAPGIILNKDGAFQRSIGFRGPDLESSTPNELVSICARVNNTLRRFGSGWALYFEATRVPATGYAVSEFDNPAAWIVDQERQASFDDTDRFFESRYYLTLSFLPPADKSRRAENLLIETPDNESGVEPKDYLASFISETNRCFDQLATLFPYANFLDDRETLTFIQSTVSAKAHTIRVPEIPAHIDCIVGGSDFVGGLVPRLGGEALHILTVRGFPGETAPGILDALNGLGFSYRWSSRFLPLDKSEATKLITKQRRQWFAKRKSVAALLKETLFNETSALVDSDADNKAIDADAALQDLGADYVGYGYLTTSIIVHHTDAAVAEDRIKAIERIVNGCGFVTIHESVNAVDAWLGSIPGNPYANVRLPLVSSLNLAHLMPLSAIWSGPDRNAHLDGPPLLTAATNGHTPFRLVTHQGDVGHGFIVGPTGAGKSVLISLLALQFQRYDNAQVFLFDKGRSARAAILAMEGDYYDLGASESMLDNSLCFQPLKDIDQPGERAWALEWLLGILAHENVEITPAIKDCMWSALENLATSSAVQRTLTGLSALLQNRDLTQALQPYTLEGAHGHLLDGDEETLSLSAIQCFEMETLMHKPGLVFPVLTYLFHRLEARFDGQPTFLILDEAWIFLDNPLFSGRIREWLKTLRKKNVSVIFATQSLADIADSEIAPAIIESCPSRIFLPNDRALEPGQSETYCSFGLNERQIGIIAESVPKRDYYFQSRAGNRLFELGLGPVALAFCGAGSESDQAAIDKILKTQGSAQFAKAWLEQEGLSWAADLICSQFGSAKSTMNTNQEKEYVPWVSALEAAE